MKTSSLAVGDNLDGYSIVQRLAVHASESEVYICEKAARTYILKYYINEHIDDTIAAILLNCTDKNVVRFIDFGYHKNRCFEVLAYMQDGSLGDTDTNGNYIYLPLDYNTLYAVIRQLNNALHTIHSKNIIHRDIKPENILYAAIDNYVCISDFGLSSILPDNAGLCAVPTRARTEGYAGPEIYSSTAGIKTDYYALGITIWRLATGLDPFVDENKEKIPHETIQRLTTNGEVAPMLLKQGNSLNKALQQLILHLLAVHYDERWGYDEVCHFLR